MFNNLEGANKKNSKFSLNHRSLEKALIDFLAGKSEPARALFHTLLKQFDSIGEVQVYTAKSMICIGRRRNFAYVIYFGKNFIDIVLPFKQTFDDNLCFKKIKMVPGQGDFNHHLRLYSTEDFNEEVLKYMKMAYNNAG